MATYLVNCNEIHEKLQAFVSLVDKQGFGYNDLAKTPTAHHQPEVHIPNTYTVYNFNMKFSWRSAVLALQDHRKLL